jgi:hypothetical protein
LSNLFAREDCTEEVEAILHGIPQEVHALQRALLGPLPEVEPGDQCSDPWECPFIDRCWPEPPRHAIETLYRLSRDRRDEYRERGYRTILDLPRDEELNAVQERQRRAARKNGLVVEKGLGEALGALERPLAFLDFETIGPPVPVWKGCRPYDQVPVQLSVHRETPGGRVVHHEWLAEGAGDPRETVARKLLEFTRGARTILAYNATFERRCVAELAEHLPGLAGRLAEIEEKIVDLLPIVRDHVYHPDFRGRFGLKSVAPCLVPGLDYEELEIGEGGEAAQVLFMLLLREDSLKKSEKARLRRDLLKYCRLDTLALLKLHRRLEGLTLQV